MPNDDLKHAVFQNLNEVSESILYLNALIGMSKAKKENKILFLRLASDALKNDIMTHLFRVLDKTKNTGSFWYIYKREKIEVDSFVKKELINFKLICDLSSNNRLYKIRNKSHFHLDKNYTFNQADAWSEANISSRELKLVLESLHHILSHLFEKFEGKPFLFPEYEGDDAALLVDRANT